MTGRSLREIWLPFAVIAAIVLIVALLSGCSHLMEDQCTGLAYFCSYLH